MKYLTPSSGVLVNNLPGNEKEMGEKGTEIFKVPMPWGFQKPAIVGWVTVMYGHLYFIYFTGLGQVPTFYPQWLEQLPQYSLPLIHMLPKFRNTKFVNYMKDHFSRSQLKDCLDE